MGRMKEVFMQMRNTGLIGDPGEVWPSLADELLSLVEKGYWVQVSPLAKTNPSEWIVAIYKKGKTSWVTESCKSNFDSPKEAYAYAFAEIEKQK